VAEDRRALRDVHTVGMLVERTEVAVEGKEDSPVLRSQSVVAEVLAALVGTEADSIHHTLAGRVVHRVLHIFHHVV
jgi:hypothetical protein